MYFVYKVDIYLKLINSLYVKGVAGKGQAVDNPPYNDIVRLDG
jgi:hypothetical protein